MKLIDKEKLLEDLKQKRYSKQSLELIQKQPEIPALTLEEVEENFPHSEFIQNFIFVMHYIEAINNEKNNEINN